ncbi:MAG: DUF2497 domain-containing protein [Hyphomicrobiaceae bacterium]
MSRTEKNGESTMADILASIRRQAAEREAAARAASPTPRPSNPIAAEDRSLVDGAAGPDDGFPVSRLVSAADLPEILRPAKSHAGPALARLDPVARPRTRLTEALRVVSAAPPRAESTPHPAAVAPRTDDASTASAAGSTSAVDAAPVSPSGAGPSSEAGRAAADEMPESGAPEAEPRRVMVSFKDTRMARMGQGDGAASEPPVAALVPAPPMPLAAPRPVARPSEPEDREVANTPPATLDAVRDGAAELLRPVLRRWLADNMPRIVERALHMELADGVAPMPQVRTGSGGARDK